MTKTVTFQTPKGTAIKLSLVTERGAVADATRMVDTWELEAQVGNEVPTGYRVGLEDHPTAGRVLRIGNGLAPIPADKLAEVEALVSEYKDGLEVRRAARDARLEAEAEYIRRSRFIASDGGMA